MYYLNLYPLSSLIQLQNDRMCVFHAQSVIFHYSIHSSTCVLSTVVHALMKFCVTIVTRLTGEKDALVQEITSLKDDIQKRQEYLDSLQPSLNTLLKVRIVHTCICPHYAECSS